MQPFRLGPMLLLMLLGAVPAGCWSPTQPEVPDSTPTPAPVLTPAPLRAAPAAPSYANEYAACLLYLNFDDPPATYGHLPYWKRDEAPVMLDGLKDYLPRLYYGSPGKFMAITALRDGRYSVQSGSMILYKFQSGPPKCMAPPGVDPAAQPPAPVADEPAPSELIGK